MDKVLQKWNVGRFQSESQGTSLSNSESLTILKLFKLLWAKIFLVTTSLLPHLFCSAHLWRPAIVYTLHIKKIPQKWEIKWELCLYELHWHSHSYTDIGDIFNSQHILRNREVLTRSSADRESNHYLKLDSFHQDSTVLSVGVQTKLAPQDFGCSLQHNHLYHVIQSHLQQLLKRGEVNRTFKVLLSLSIGNRDVHLRHPAFG